jgi:hypothetical protein
VLFQLPGVHAVSVQPKIVGGVRTREFAVVVHAARKIATDALPAEHVVPEALDGVRTVVLESPRWVAGGPSTDMDTDRYATVIGGACLASDSLTRTVNVNRRSMAASCQIVVKSGKGKAVPARGASDPTGALAVNPEKAPVSDRQPRYFLRAKSVFLGVALNHA